MNPWMLQELVEARQADLERRLQRPRLPVRVAVRPSAGRAGRPVVVGARTRQPAVARLAGRLLIATGHALAGAGARLAGGHLA